MKTLVILIAFLVSGCQITVAKLPPPVETDVAAALQQHAQLLNVLVEDYKKRNPDKTK